ncbi:MAG: sulfotransferase [Gammaproteobacteria bacterium]|nr:sulfotransferase [Gammaproteobacteria bacterium]MDH3767663.1 sulfotransferase [Gammaproteobacteria bacterium]
MVIIGLGTGRSGTASLAKLLNAQTDAHCFHELNPSCVRFCDTPRPILNTIAEFQGIIDGGDPSRLTVDLSRPVSASAYERLMDMRSVRLIGDIAFYYLSYVEEIHKINPNVRFLCLRRNREETVQSWMRKTAINRWPSKYVADRMASIITRTPFYTARNPWMEHDGSEWAIDEVWDKCFPKFPGPTRQQAIEQYWDYYGQEADRLCAKLSEVFKIVDTNKLSANDYQSEILEFCGIANEDQVFTDAHIHKS